MYGIYLHFPFCISKCHYCDFYSITELSPIDNFVNALCKEIQLQDSISRIHKPKVDTIFLGGGTPSLLKPSQLEIIIETLYKYFDIAQNTEFTIECNPGTLTETSLKEFRGLGINRLSIGVQSFNQDELKFLQRIHTTDDAVKSIEIARKSGFENISIDLIFSIPGQTLESWNNTLEKTISMELEHISAYSLIYEKDTPLYNDWLNHKVEKTDEETEAKYYETLIEKLVNHGLEHYEVSNFAKPNKKCRHNLKYWQGEEYFAFGPSANGYLNNTRYWNVKNLKLYFDSINQNKLPIEGSEHISRETKIIERAFLELRAEGIRIQKFKDDFQFDILTELKEYIRDYEKEGFIKLSEDKIKLTTKGYLLCEEISVQIMSAIEKRLKFK